MADKKPEKKEEKKGGGTNAELIALYWVIGVIIFLSFFLTNFNGTLFSTDSTPIEDPQTGKVIGTNNGFKFPTGNLGKGVNVILKDDTFVRSAPAQSLLGKQKEYETGMIQEGPLQAFSQNWWRVNFEEAPDGWVPEYAFTSYVKTYKAVYVIPITWGFMKPVLWVLSIILAVILMAAKIRLGTVRAEAGEKLKPKTVTPPPIKKSTDAHIVVGEEEEKEILTAGDRRSNDRWMHIVQLLQSHNQNDWRQAIIEADIILEDMLDKMGYDGNSIGDKLKNVEPSDFRTLQQAWEAHKVRNRIAHMGSEFQVSHQDAERVINLYQEVFDEFYYI